MFPDTNTITMKAGMNMSITTMFTRINITTIAVCMRLSILFITFRYRTR